MSRHRTPTEAKKLIAALANQGRYTLRGHFSKRADERDVTVPDVLYVLVHPRRVEPYAGMPQHGGDCWRVHGRDVDGTRTIAIGVEIYEDGGETMAVCTTFPREKP